MNKRKIITVLCALLCLSLAGCGKNEETAEPEPVPVEFRNETVQSDTQSLDIVLEEGEIEKLDELAELTELTADGSECVEELAQWAEEHPEVNVHYTVELPDGRTVESDVTELDLSEYSAAQVQAAAETLSLLPELESIMLGSEERENAPALEDVKLLLDNAPKAVCDYQITRFKKTFNLSDEALDLNHRSMDDGGAEVRTILDCMPGCTYLDMDFCGVSNEDMAAIRDDYPNVKVVWRVWFAGYSVRTDVEKILASCPGKAGQLTAANTEPLKYCTDVKYLDIGHNDYLYSIEFVAYMPKLEVAVVSLCNYTDASPLANCKNLEYLEIQTTKVSDLTPLAGLVNLHHLNIGYLFDCTDITPLNGLTNLERLWIGQQTPIPAEQVEEFMARVPDCEVNLTNNDPTTEGWRRITYQGEDGLYYQEIAPRYELLRAQFGYSREDYSFWWKDPKYFFSG